METHINIAPVRNDEQYRQYLEEVDMLMDLDPSPDSPEGERLEILAILIEDFEEKQGWNLPHPGDPVKVIKTRMKDLDLNQKDLVPAIGDKTVISRILNRKRNLTYSMIAPLSKLLHIPPELLLK